MINEQTDKNILEYLGRIQARLDGIEAEIRALRAEESLLQRGRRESRANVAAEGLGDAEIVQMIKEARQDVAPLIS